MGRNSSVPDSAKFTIEEYLTERKMSSLPVLLVEGKDDSIFFQLIRDELLKLVDRSNVGQMKALSCIEIDTAEIIKSPQDNPIGNRSKVEYICKMADDLSLNQSLVGFVDREFREFNLSPYFEDCLKVQNNIGRVVWSRGHSVENHLFEFVILRDTLRDIGINSMYPIQDALDIFKMNFKSIIALSCATSLAAKDVALIKALEATMPPSCFTFNDCDIHMNMHEWNNFLCQNIRLDSLRSKKFLDQFIYYLEIANGADFETLRWLCHGHIGLNFISSAFEACMNKMLESQHYSVEQKKRGVDKTDRFIRFSTSWIQKQLRESHNFENTPIKCFQMLGFSPSPYSDS